MTLRAALAALLLAVPASAAPGTVADLSGYLSAWSQDCSNGCALPAAQGRSAAASLSVEVPETPGEARAASLERDFVFAGGERVHARVSVYYLCPRDAVSAPGSDPCPARYLQVQTVLSGDAAAFCAASLNPADAVPFPVMMCAGDDLRRPRVRLGVSLSRLAVASLLRADP